MFERELLVGDNIGRGEDGGEPGCPVTPRDVKKGKGAIVTSSSSVRGAEREEPLEDTEESVGLETRTDDAPSVKMKHPMKQLAHTSVCKSY